MHSDSSGSRNRTGGLSVSLASPDGRVVGGGVGGMLIAASPVQVFSCLLYLLYHCSPFSFYTIVLYLD
jgi:hypothetical protein